MKYTIAKKLFSTALNCFYSKVTVHGDWDIPDNQPVLFIANHNNAFIDPLLLTARLDRQVTFTAKHTLAKNPLLNVILKSFSVELLSRQIDRRAGDNAKANNAAVLTRLQHRLKEGGAVFIFPEGRSHCDTQMHEFKTGAARLALDYAKLAQNDETCKDLLVVPLGLHYSDKSVFRSDASIEIGEPISVKAWLLENPDTCPRQLTAHFKQAVQKSLDRISSRARQSTLKPHVPATGVHARYALPSFEKRVVGAPFAALGWVLNAVPFALTRLLVKKLSTDHDHPASAAIVVGPPLFAIAHAVQLLCVAAFGSIVLALLYVLLLLPASVLALKAVDQIFNVKQRYPAIQS